MNIQIKSSNGITMVPLDALLMSSRKIFIEGEITQELACEFIKKIIYLNLEDNKTPIHCMINSIGGEINSGLLIYDAIQSSNAPIQMYCIGKAYSIAALIFSSGIHGRYLLPHSELMLHEPLLDSQISGKASCVKSASDRLMEAKKKINQIIADHTGKSVEHIEEVSGYDHFFDSQECISFGLADKIICFSDLLSGGCMI